MARRWTGVLARMGVPTGDGRILDPAGMSFRELPVPLLWQEKTAPGHDGSVTVGTVDSVTMANGMMIGEGRLLDKFPDAERLMELIDERVVGPSVDLADNLEYVMDDQERTVITRASIGGVTLVPIEAFADVSIEMVDSEEGVDAFEEFLYASAAPAQAAPAAWFENPSLPGPMPLTIMDDGRVFGHIATWGSCHVGLPGCVTPPASPSGYAYFHQSSQLLDDGSHMPVGTLVAGPRHADAQAAFQAAMAHYDDPSAAVARVVAGDDEHGIWVAGWLLPGASDEAVQVFRSSPVSGDWRRIGGNLEMIAVCSVNAPGFPIPRARVAFSNGHQRTLIGTFGITPVSAQETDQAIAERDQAAGLEARPMTADEGAMIGESLFSPVEASGRPEAQEPTIDAETARAKWAWTMAEKEI